MKLLIGGDFCPKEKLSKLIENDDFNFLDEYKKLLIKESIDFAVVNLECPIATDQDKPIAKNGPNLKCNAKIIDSLVYAGVNMVTLANNHIMDYGATAMFRTKDLCESNGILTVGIGRNLAEAGNILYANISGQKVAFINCCEHEYSVAEMNEPGTNPLNSIKQSYAIKRARDNADYVIVIVHGGHEHFQLPSSRMVEIYRFFINNGADAVINHHQHCYSGYEIYNGKPIFYGLGNFCFDSDKYNVKSWNEGILVELILGEDVSFKIFPYIQSTNEHTGIHLLPTDSYDDKLKELNDIISNDEKLLEVTNAYYDSCSTQIECLFGLFNNRYLSAAYRRNLIPSFLTKNIKKIMENYVTCESHHDKLVRFFKTQK